MFARPVFHSSLFTLHSALALAAAVLLSAAVYAQVRQPVNPDDPIALAKNRHADLLCVTASEFDPFRGGVEFRYDPATDTVLVTYLPPTLLEDDMFKVIEQLAGEAPLNEVLAAAGMAPIEKLVAAAAAKDNATRNPVARHLPLPSRPPVRPNPVVIGKVTLLTPHGVNVLARHKIAMQERVLSRFNLLLPAFQRNVSPGVKFTFAGF